MVLAGRAGASVLGWASRSPEDGGPHVVHLEGLDEPDATVAASPPTVPPQRGLATRKPMLAAAASGPLEERAATR
ncbi:hypothetical protein GCM10009737_00780 [Nocardioides lentus]|uniref:Uncharacterized protein n=1 Tax=Nocardioides lentus TaxID=338077 RepID=A0ABP5A860_9ACTN